MKFNFRKLKNSLLSLGLTATLLFPSGLHAFADGPTTLDELKQAIAEVPRPYDATWLLAVRELSFRASRNGVNPPLFDGCINPEGVEGPAYVRLSYWPPTDVFYVDTDSIAVVFGCSPEALFHRMWRIGYKSVGGLELTTCQGPQGEPSTHKCSRMTPDTDRAARLAAGPTGDLAPGAFTSVSAFLHALREVPPTDGFRRTSKEWLHDILAVCERGLESEITAASVPAVYTNTPGKLLVGPTLLSACTALKRKTAVDRMRDAGYAQNTRLPPADELRRLFRDLGPRDVTTWRTYWLRPLRELFVPPGSGGAQPDRHPFRPQPAEGPPGYPRDIMSLKFMLN
jgi:hypothetical protein